MSALLTPLVFQHGRTEQKAHIIFLNDAVEFLMYESKDLDAGYEVCSRENDSDEEAILFKEH